MRGSGADLHVGEIRRHVRVRLAIRLLYHDWRSPGGGCLVAEPAILVVSPGVCVPVTAYRQGKTFEIVFSSADLAEPDASAGVWRGDSGLLPAHLAALVWVDSPRVVGVLACPFGGEGEVFCDGFAEVVGDFANEPSVEQVAFARRVGRRSLHSTVRVGDLLQVRRLASSCCVEADRVCGACLCVSGQLLVDRVAEASVEGLAVLFADDSDGGLSRFVGGSLDLPGSVLFAEFHWLAVHAGCFQNRCLRGV